MSCALVLLLTGCALDAPRAPGAASESRAPALTPNASPPAAPTAAPTASPPAARTAVELLFVRVDDIIDDAELESLRQLAGVTEITATRRDDVAIIASARADGTPVDSLPNEFKISVAGQVDDGALALRPNEVALTVEALPLRDLDVGGTLTLGDGGTRTITAIVEGAGYAGVELIIAPAAAADLSFRPRQRALLTLAADADPGAVATAARGILGSDTVTQLRSSNDRQLVLSLPETKARFGEFAFKDLDGRDVQVGVSWIEESIIEAQIPIIGRVVCHRLIIDDLTAVMQQIIDVGLAREIDPELYGGCWAPRRINRNANLSRHAWGIAIDVNVDFEAAGLGPIPSPGIIAAFERHGFRWGGRYPTPDNHHFEWVGL
jgi:hypothetical protein